MELIDYIKVAREKYPNGYSDYIAANPNDNMETWYQLYKAMKISKNVEGTTFDVNEVVIMDKWPNDKFWLFIADINHQFEINRITKE